MTACDDGRPPAIAAEFSVEPKADRQNRSRISADPTANPGRLSVRAVNVLKELAIELTGENPPQDGWLPSGRLLQLLTFKHLSTARNCGPRTTAEIVQWAQARGKVVRPAFHVGKSLSDMWQDAVTKFATRDISKAEVLEVLEHSVRRRNTRIPLAFQSMLLQMVKSSNE